jgi:hypothetical protein
LSRNGLYRRFPERISPASHGAKQKQGLSGLLP